MKYELKKLLSEKFLIFAMLVLLVANCILAYRAAPDDKSMQSALAAFFAEYESDPAFYDQRYDEYLSAREQAINDQIEAVMRGEDPEEYAFEEPRTIAPDTGYTDIELYSALYQRKGYGNRYREKLLQIIDETENNLQVVTDPYLSSYLKDVREAYTAMYSLPHSDNRLSGWDAYFSYNGMGILLLFGVIAACLLLATADGKAAEQILFVSAKGFRGILRQKILALFAFCAIGVVLFELSAFLLFCSKTSFAGAGEFLASVESYMLCPFAVYIYEYVLIRIVIRIVVLFTSGVCLLTAARLIPNAFGYFACCAAFAGVNYLAESSKTAPTGSVLQSMNLFHLLEPASFFKQYASVNVWGRSVPLYLAGLLLCVALICGCLAGLLLFWNQTKRPKRITVKRPAFPQYTPRTAFGFECKKLLIGQKLLLPAVVLISFKIILCAAVSQQTIPYREQLYRGYMLTLQGEPSAEKKQYLEEEQAAFDASFALAEERRQQYENGEITYAKLLASNLELHGTEIKYEVFLQAKNAYERIKTLNESGAPARIVYETGWKKLLLSGPDLLLVLLLLPAAFAYSAENSEKLRPILHTTTRGRMRMFLSKLCVCTAFAVIGCTLFTLADLWSASNAYSLSEWDAPAKSISSFESADAALTLRGAFWTLLAKKIGLSAILTCIAVCISQAARNKLFAPVVFAAGIFIPHGICLFVGGNTKYVSIPQLFRFSPAFDPKTLPIVILIVCLCIFLLIRTVRSLSKA